jgi:hypothetical protein
LQRNKAAIIASGNDPDLKQLRRLQWVRSNQEKKYVKALEDIEDYWEKVFKSIEHKKGSAA